MQLREIRADCLIAPQGENVVPKIFFSNTSYEYWGRAAALIHVSADGKRDVAISDNVRIYHFTGLQHFSGPFPPARGTGDELGQEPESPLPIKYFWRAMITNMDAWVRNNVAPPRSSYPKIADGTLVPLAAYALPAIPGLIGRMKQRRRIVSTSARIGSKEFSACSRRSSAKRFLRLCRRWMRTEMSAMACACLRSTVPLATITGWNLRDPSIGAAEQRVAFEASYLPFPRDGCRPSRTATRAIRLRSAIPAARIISLDTQSAGESDSAALDTT